MDKNEIKKRTYHAHDRFFKKMMVNNQVAKEFFMTHLPAEVLEVIDLNCLELQPTSYIDDHCRESISDILFKTRIKGYEAYLYLMVDHQSQPDKWMPWRVMKCTCNVIDQKMTTDHVIPLVIPLVVYHGKRSWLYSRDIKDLVSGPKELIDTYFLKPFLLVDLNKIEDEILKEHAWSGIMDMAMKYIYVRDMWNHFNPGIVNLLKIIIKTEEGKRVVKIVINYIIDRAEISNKEAFVDLIKETFTEELGEEVMTLAEQWREEGRQESRALAEQWREEGRQESRALAEQWREEGVQKGLEQGSVQEKYKIAERLLAENVEIAFIAKITGLSVEKIKEMVIEIA